MAREAPREGKIEARGQLLDIGRMSQDDPRLIPFNLLDRVRAAYQDRWPKPGEELILLLGGTGSPPPATDVTSPPLRAIAMEPARFDGQKVTITGQFRGRNLFGDLPEAPTQGRFEFVLRSGDAALWVMGLQPKGKTFNLDPGKRIDTGRWLKVQGTVHSAKGLTWLDGTSIDLAAAPEETTEVAIDLPPPPPVEILFYGAGGGGGRCAIDRTHPDAAVARSRSGHAEGPRAPDLLGGRLQGARRSTAAVDRVHDELHEGKPRA